MSNYRQGTNYYEILEVDRDAPQNEIHQAYQRAKSTYSADNPALYSMFSKEEAKELSRMIEEAYSVLGNHNQRKAYDQSLLQNEQTDSQPMPAASAPKSQPAPQSPQAKANAHEQLPEFDVSDAMAATSGVGESYIVRKREAPKPTLPPGTGRTSLSTYKVDEAFESEIANIDDWDGSLLKKVRTYKGVSLDQVSDATRISKTYLNAVESNDYASLPAPVFVRGFVVQLARILGLNENKVATSYMKILKAKSGQ